MVDTGKLQIIQNEGSPDFMRRVATYTITGVSQGAKTFTINEDVVQKLSDESITQLSISGSTGNDDIYTINSTAGATVFTVDEAIPDATVDGQVELWNDLDSQTGKLPLVAAENQPLMGGGGAGDDTTVTNYRIYIGSATSWVGFGLLMSTFGDYGAFTWEYYNDDLGDWKEFTVLYDSTGKTGDFSGHGVVVWGSLEDWELFTVNTQSAFWVRVSAASMATRGSFFNLLRNITLFEPSTLETNIGAGLQKTYFDHNGKIQKADITNKTKRGTLQIGTTHLATNQEGITQMKLWHQNDNKLWIIDFARTNPVNFLKDAFIRNYQAYITKITGPIESPFKEQPRTYTIDCIFDDIITSAAAVVSETFEDQGGGSFDWTRLEGDASTDPITGDGGDTAPTQDLAL